MDAEWLAALGDKDYLFPLRWPVSAWLVNLGYVVGDRLALQPEGGGRRDDGGGDGARGGCLALAAVFAVAVAA